MIKKIESLIVDETDKTIASVNNNEISKLKKSVSDILKVFLAQFSGDKNIYQRLNKRMTQSDWSDVVKDLKGTMETLDTNSRKLLQYEISISGTERKQSKALELLILAEILRETNKINDKIDRLLKGNVKKATSIMADEYGLEFSDLTEDDYDSFYGWSGKSYKDRNVVNSTMLSMAIVSAIILELNRNTEAKKIREQTINRITSWSKKNMETIIRTENVAFIDSALKRLYNDNDIEYVQFKTVGDGHTCKVCQMYEDEIFRVEEAIQLPIHPNERCYYIPVDNPNK